MLDGHLTAHRTEFICRSNQNLPNITVNYYGRPTRGRTQNSNISCRLENAPLSCQINSKKRTWVAEEDPFLGLRVDVVTVAEQTQGVDV